jgi:hypothetical protein
VIFVACGATGSSTLRRMAKGPIVNCREVGISMDYFWRLWDALVAFTGPFGAAALVAFIIVAAIALLLSRLS